MVLLELILLGIITFTMFLGFVAIVSDKSEVHPISTLFFVVGIITNVVAMRMISHFL